MSDGPNPADAADEVARAVIEHGDAPEPHVAAGNGHAASATEPVAAAVAVEEAAATADDSPEPTPAPAAATPEASAPPPPRPRPRPAPKSTARDEALDYLDRGIVQAEKGVKAAFRALVERRGLRIAVIGVLLVLLALWLGGGSALSIPLGVVGAVMIVVGAMGPRLRGRFVLEFGPGGTVIEVSTHIAPPGSKGRLPAPDQTPAQARQALVAPEEHAASLESPPPDADVIDSSGETVEIDVEQLKALIAAEEQRRA